MLFILVLFASTDFDSPLIDTTLQCKETIKELCPDISAKDCFSQHFDKLEEICSFIWDSKLTKYIDVIESNNTVNICKKDVLKYCRDPHPHKVITCIGENLSNFSKECQAALAKIDEDTIKKVHDACSDEIDLICRDDNNFVFCLINNKELSDKCVQELHNALLSN